MLPILIFRSWFIYEVFNILFFRAETLMRDFAKNGSLDRDIRSAQGTAGDAGRLIHSPIPLSPILPPTRGFEWPKIQGHLMYKNRQSRTPLKQLDRASNRIES